MKITRMAYDNDLNLTGITVEDYDGSEYELEVVQYGKWGAPEIVGYDGTYPVYALPCSECGKYTKEHLKPFCPNCGAKMRLEEEHS